ncbi:hypothetical protein Pst134EA_017704 [Puccinia striiformis f. sp. tritici]|uniref:hypothetical protein n=1 Tax=Puccinia striiformis f. sp. tritici TaxID=168172 RepID=UPI002007A3E5|nr:hypothetical protein Pst134EA_017704 [Puccinia striiformis f. sp. tritici]KAH9461398.1 hypothetical protein Pst134EA_017704 [Puccinia striiformis f. sp. tritici]
MLVLLKGVFVCAFLHIVDASIVTALSEEAHATQDSVITLRGNAQAKSSDTIINSTPVESSGTPVESSVTPVESSGTPVESSGTPVESSGNDQLEQKEYGIIPETKSERDAERERMSKDRLGTKDQIALLDPKSHQEFIDIKSQLQELHHALKIPTIIRVYRLSGLNWSLDLLLPRSIHKSPKDVPGVGAESLAMVRSQENLPARILQSPKTRKNMLWSTGLRILMNSRRKPRTEPRKPSSIVALPGNPLGKAVPRMITDLDPASSPVVTTLAVRKGAKSGTAESSMSSSARVEHGEVQRGRVDTTGMIDFANSLRKNRLASQALESSPKGPTELTRGGHPSNTAALVPSQDGSSTDRQTLHQALSGGKGIPIGNLPISSTRRGLLDGEELEIVHGKVVKPMIELWNPLEKKLIDFQTAHHDALDDIKAEFQRDFLKSLFLLGDYIFTYGLLPSEFIENIKIFQPQTVKDMVKFHIELLFLKHKNKFFVAPDSVIPQLEFLTTGSAVKHLHRSIKALTDEDQQHVVYLSLRTVVSHALKNFPDRQLGSAYTDISSRFCRDEFLDEARRLSSALRDEPDIDHLKRSEHSSVVRLIEKLLIYFRSPMSTVIFRRLGFQLTFYILEYLEHNFQPIMEAMLREDEPILFQMQLKFTSSYLKFFRNRDQYPITMYENPDMSFLTMWEDESKDPDSVHLRRWIRVFFVDTFNHDSWQELEGTTPTERYNIWMARLYGTSDPSEVMTVPRQTSRSASVHRLSRFFNRISSFS